MARDYKNRARGRKKKKQVSPLLMVGAGLLVGLFVAFLVFIKMQNSPQQPQLILQTPDKNTTQEAASAQSEDVRDVRKDTREPIKPPTPAGPRFEFYDLLPEMEVVVPEPDPVVVPKPPAGTAATKQPTPAAKPTATPRQTPAVAEVGTWFLQVASVKDATQADRLRAELALLGLETSIQTVTIDNKDTYHRVRVGPFTDLDTLNAARRTLNQRGHESKLIKLKE